MSVGRFDHPSTRPTTTTNGGCPSATTTACSRSSASKGSRPVFPGLLSCENAKASEGRLRSSTRRVVAGFDDADIARLLGDPGIIRHRGKIVATIANAQSTVRLAGQGVRLAALVWRYEPGARPPPKTLSDLPASTPESKALSAELRRNGFRFVGETTAYAAMQSLGLVNDHLKGCHSRAIAELARANFEVPV